MNEMTLRKISYAECLKEQREKKERKEKEGRLENPHPSEVPEDLVFLGLVYSVASGGVGSSSDLVKLLDLSSDELKETARKVKATHLFSCGYEMVCSEPSKFATTEFSNHRNNATIFVTMSGEVYWPKDYR